jgi:hypothetical protein
VHHLILPDGTDRPALAEALLPLLLSASPIGSVSSSKAGMVGAGPLG